MQDVDLFLSLAEIAGVFVGFGALIAVRSGITSDVYEVTGISMVCWIAIHGAVDGGSVPLLPQPDDAGDHPGLLGLAVVAGTTAGTVLVVSLAASLLVYLTRLEEGELAERFGEAYLAYRRETPFIVPRPRRRR